MNKFYKNLKIFLLSGIVFLAATMPFRNILSVFTVSEVRPAAVLNPFLGISFGLPAALGIAAANLLADGLSGYPVAVLIEGLIPQFLYSYVPYLMWRAFTKNEEHIHRLDSVSRVRKYTAVVLTYAVLSGLCVGAIVQTNFGADFLNCAFFVFLNNFTMSMVLGCPLMILSNQIMARRSGNDRRLFPSEKLILADGIAELLIIGIVIAAVYARYPDLGVNELWNMIYIDATVIIIASMAVTLFLMILFERRKKRIV